MKTDSGFAQYNVQRKFYNWIHTMQDYWFGLLLFAFSLAVYFFFITKASIILLQYLNKAIHQAIRDHTALRATIIILITSNRNLLNIF